MPLRLGTSLWQRYEGAAPAEELGKPSEVALADGIVDGAARRGRTRRPDLTVSTEVLPEEPEYALCGRDATPPPSPWGPEGAAASPSS
ncbi:hypothetical protein ACFW2D_36830 [Streptomyces sp. NPDC058914]|uniref:hypothetical protein n=1 Tax=Streptomyces sp. NPDC058914 TaxID=3346671 RepID=UPI00368C02CF